MLRYQDLSAEDSREEGKIQQRTRVQLKLTIVVSKHKEERSVAI